MLSSKSTSFLFAGAAAVVTAFTYFAWQARVRQYTRVESENDRTISEALHFDCRKFEVSDVIGWDRTAVNQHASLANSILLKGSSGTVRSDNTDPEFSRAVKAQVGSEPSRNVAGGETEDRIETQTYTVCGLKLVAVIYENKIVDAIYIPEEKRGKRVFGIDQ